MTANPYGRLNKKGDAVAMMLAHKENSVTVNRAKTMTEEELEGKNKSGKSCTIPSVRVHRALRRGYQNAKEEK